MNFLANASNRYEANIDKVLEHCESKLVTIVRTKEKPNWNKLNKSISAILSIRIYYCKLQKYLSALGSETDKLQNFELLKFPTLVGGLKHVQSV